VALRRQGLTRVYVDPWEIRFVEPSDRDERVPLEHARRFSFRTPPDALVFIDDFDEERPVAPFTLRLELAEESA
jgi:hypothetical protein